MRRAAALLVIPLLAGAAAAGCSSSSSSSADTTNSSVTATGKFGANPKVTIPAKKADSALITKTLIQGSGAKMTTADTLEANFVLYDWSGTTHKLLGSTFTQGGPTLFSSQMLPGLEKAVIGHTLGSRVLAVIPPKDAFGAQGNPQIGIKGTDTLVWVIDLDKLYSNTAGVSGTQATNGGGALPTVIAAATGAPSVTIPAANPPKALQIKPLITGAGPKVKSGQELLVQYTGVNWRTKKVFDSSWKRKQPYMTAIGVGQVLPGWDKGLIGQTVGSRVLLVIPPAQGYGKTGSASAGIKGTDTLVFVVDIMAAVG
ncbi:MAG TPA: FKBP-type peptidyl-prolyl cis-trans isomerase [Trebonia sp.]|jgi:peptidylprolyl isomerase